MESKAKLLRARYLHMVETISSSSTVRDEIEAEKRKAQYEHDEQEIQLEREESKEADEEEAEWELIKEFEFPGRQNAACSQWRKKQKW
jgi:hypothetical protein